MSIETSASARTEAPIERIHPKFRPVWEGRSAKDRAALADYFLPHRSRKPVVGPTRPRVVKWYCPFASQRDFASGHRYCINVYTGCAHGCVYCYAAGYSPERAAVKRDFQRLIDRDMADLERFDVPPAPVHLSNSTDPFQPLETSTGHTRYALERILAHRHRFTSVVVLTKNPLMAVERGYVELFKALAAIPTDHPWAAAFERSGRPAFLIEVSLAFWRDSARRAYDPGAPSVAERIEGLGALGAAGVPVALRIDPLFPRSPLPTSKPKTLADFGLPEAQTLDDLDNLVGLAGEVGARHVIRSAAKIVQPMRRRLSPTMQAMRRVYEALSTPDRPIFRGGSWRLSPTVADEHVVRPFLEICDRHGVATRCCKSNLIGTP